jgi:hypothetical protein
LADAFLVHLEQLLVCHWRVAQPHVIAIFSLSDWNRRTDQKSQKNE